MALDLLYRDLRDIFELYKRVNKFVSITQMLNFQFVKEAPHFSNTNGQLPALITITNACFWLISCEDLPQKLTKTMYVNRVIGIHYFYIFIYFLFLFLLSYIIRKQSLPNDIYAN